MTTGCVGGLCYFLVCYQNSDHVSFLISSLYRDEDLFIIHCDPKAPDRLKQLVHDLSKSKGNILLLEPQQYSWAGYSHVDLSFKAIKRALEAGHDWIHFLFLSEQHLPLKSPDQISAYLSTRRSVFISQKASDFYPAGRDDLINRFSSIFRELPGVGSFATGPRKDYQALFDRAYHGSNWIALSREHCVLLDNAFDAGDVEVYRTIVHSEELAIPTLLSSVRGEIEQVDIVLVATPRLTDNHSLVMTEELFLSAYSSEFLFIRKRSAILSNRVIKLIKDNHFVDIEAISDAPSSMHGRVAAWQAYFVQIMRYLDERYKHLFELIRLDPENWAPSPIFHLQIKHADLPLDISIRVLSEDLSTFKVSIVQDAAFNGRFTEPKLVDGYYHSILRVRVYGLFGNTEILPDTVPNAGFVDRVTINDIGALLEMIGLQVDAALTYCRT
jgi:Core-2/I-Branching enzyme